MPELLRVVAGTRGQVRMKLELVIRFDYGSVVPWVRQTESGISAIAGPDMIRLRADVPLHSENMKTGAEFTVAEGQKVSFDLTWYPSHEREPEPVNVEAAIENTEKWWREWSDRCTYQGKWRDAVLRSLITLKGSDISCPRAASWRRRQLRCPNCWAACATGITVFAGCGMRL